MTEELLFDKSLKKIAFVFRLTGLNITTEKRSQKQNFIFFFNLLWHQTDVISAFMWVIFGMFSGKNFTEFTQVVPCLIFGVLADIKGIFLLIKESKAHCLIDSLRNCENKANEFVNSERHNLITTEIKRLNFTIKVLNVLNYSMLIAYVIIPLLYIAVKYLMTGQLELILPFLDVYPFDSYDLRYWPFAYAHQLWSACFALFEVCATDYFFFTCCTHIRIQFKLLGQQFRGITYTKSVFKINSIDQIAVKAKFHKLVEWHQQIINSANMLEGIYSKSTLCNFLASSLMICLTGFNVTNVDNTAVVVTFITFLSTSMLQVFSLCFFADIMMSSSTDVADAVYNSKWYLSDVAHRKSLLLVQMRAQNPCKLTASGFADVNLRAFMKIMSTAWSYFALLQTIYHHE